MWSPRGAACRGALSPFSSPSRRKVETLPNLAMEASERAFSPVHMNARSSKPRQRGITEIRVPSYTVVGLRSLEDVFDTMGPYVDTLKFAGGSFALMSRTTVQRLIDLCHQHEVLVSTGGFIEYVVGQGVSAVEAYIEEAK